MIDKMKTYLSPNRFIPNDYEELTALELIGKQNAKIDEVVEGCNHLEKTKVTQGGDFNGTWCGIKRPSLATEVMPSVVDNLSLKTRGVKNLHEYIDLAQEEDWTLPFKKAISEVEDGGKLFIPSGHYIINDVVIIEGASHYTKGGITIEGEDKANTVIECGKELVDFIKLNNSKMKGYNITLKNLHIKADKCMNAISCVGSIAKSSFNHLIISGIDHCILFKEDIWQNQLNDLMLYGVNHGITMEKHGTSNKMSNIFVYGTKKIGYQLSGTYTFLDNLACDDNEGVAYYFRFCDITVGSLGNETVKGEKIIHTTNGRVSILNCTLYTTSLPSNFIGVFCHDGYVGIDQLVINSPSQSTCSGRLFDFGTLGDIRMNHLSSAITFTGLSSNGGGNKLSYENISVKVDGTDERPYLGNLNDSIVKNGVISWCDDNPNTVDGVDVQWQPPFPTGTLIICKKPKNNVVAYLRTDSSAQYNRDCTWLKLTGTTG